MTKKSFCTEIGYNITPIALFVYLFWVQGFISLSDTNWACFSLGSRHEKCTACDGSVSRILGNRAPSDPPNDKTLGYKLFARLYLGIRMKKKLWRWRKKKKKAEVLSFSQEPEGEVSVSSGSDKSATCGATPPTHRLQTANPTAPPAGWGSSNNVSNMGLSACRELGPAR